MRARFVSVSACAVVCGAAWAMPQFSSMALEGETAPGAADAALFMSFTERVSVNRDGFVCFNALLQDGAVDPTNDRGYWIGEAPGLTAKLVRAGEEAPGFGPATFGTAFDITQYASGNNVGLLGTFDGTKGVFVGGIFGLFPFVIEGESAPTRGLPPPLVTDLKGAPLINDGGEIVVSGERDGLDAIWRLIDPSRGITDLVALAGDPAPDLPGLTMSAFVDVQLNNSGQIGFRATLSGAGVTAANDTAFFFGAPGALQLVAREGNLAAGGGGLNYGAFSSTGISDNGSVAFVAALGSNVAMWKGTPGNLTRIALKGEAAPGGGNWDTFGAPLMAGDVLAFTAQTRDGFRTDRGVYRKVGANATVKIIKTRDSAAFALGAGSTIDSMSEHMALTSAGQTLFRAAAVGGQAGGTPKQALWSADQNNQPFLIMREGQGITVLLGDTRTVSAIALALNSSGQNGRARRINPDGIMGVAVEFADGSSGVLKVFANGNCPGDANGDGNVNFTDLNAVLAQFGQVGVDLDGDINDDGLVNFTDLNLVLGSFGASCVVFN